METLVLLSCSVGAKDIAEWFVAPHCVIATSYYVGVGIPHHLQMRK